MTNTSRDFGGLPSSDGGDPDVDAPAGQRWDYVHIHRMGHALVREALRFTQTDLATAMGATQSNTERRTDLVASMLARYASAMGADLHIVVQFEGRPPVKLTLDELTES